MFWRRARISELRECLAVAPCHLGSELIGAARAAAAWKSLVHSPAFHYEAIEAKPQVGDKRIVGFGSSVFVSSKFIDDELANPRPGLNTRILASVDGSASVVLTEPEIRASNTHAGLDVVVLCSCWEKDLLTPEQVSEVQVLLAISFLQDHAGYRIKRLLSEAIGEGERHFARASHTWREVRDFGNSYDHSGQNRSLWLVTQEDGLAVPGSITTMLFHYHQPLLRLHPTDQQLLLAALDGVTDHELSDRLGLTLGAIKKRWISLFSRIADTLPSLLPEMNGNGDGYKRGPQKRHRVLAYVREHPEELRPFGIPDGDDIVRFSRSRWLTRA